MWSTPRSSRAVWSTPRSSPTVWSTSRSSRAVRSTPRSSRAVWSTSRSSRAVLSTSGSSRAVWSTSRSSRAVWSTSGSSRAVCVDIPIEPRRVVNIPIEPRSVVNIPDRAAQCGRHPDRAAPCCQPVGRGESPHRRRSARSAPRNETSLCHPDCRGGTDGLAARLDRSSRAVPSIGRARRTISPPRPHSSAAHRYLIVSEHVFLCFDGSPVDLIPRPWASDQFGNRIARVADGSKTTPATDFPSPRTTEYGDCRPRLIRKTVEHHTCSGP